MFWAGFVSCLAEFRGEFESAEDIDHTFEVIGHGSKADLGVCSAKTAQQEAWMFEEAVLEHSEGILDDGSPEPHQGGCRALVHAVEYVLVHMAAQHALGSVGTAQLQGVRSAVNGLCLVERGAVLLRRGFLFDS